MHQGRPTQGRRAVTPVTQGRRDAPPSRTWPGGRASAASGPSAETNEESNVSRDQRRVKRQPRPTKSQTFAETNEESNVSRDQRRVKRQPRPTKSQTSAETKETTQESDPAPSGVTTLRPVSRRQTLSRCRVSTSSSHTRLPVIPMNEMPNSAPRVHVEHRQPRQPPASASEPFTSASNQPV